MRTRTDRVGQYAMQCMEIWGGSHAVESAVSTPGLDAWVFSAPFEGADRGGDVHYVSLCGGGVVTRLIVADVAGHGATVAELSATLRGLMRRYINSKSQGSLVRALNRRFAAQAQAGRFATAVVATYLAGRGRLTICNAGHPRPLWYRAASRHWEVMAHDVDPRSGAASNLPLGLDVETLYDQFAVALGPGDVVLIYTDALTESKGDDGRLLGEDGLLALARDLDAGDPRELGTSLLAAVRRHRVGLEADDDVTLLALYHNAGPPHRLSIGEKLDVYAKVFGLRRV